MIARTEERQTEIRLRDIEPGDRVLVEEAEHRTWQTVRDVSGEFVSTDERPEGVHMCALVRHEPATPALSGMSLRREVASR